MEENQKTQEVEIRAILKLEQKVVLENLIKTKIKGDPQTQTIIDEYFCPKSVNSFAEIEMDQVGSYSLRLRKKSIDGVAKVDMNTKTITNFGDHNAWEEHEIKIDSFEEAKNILLALGFKSFFILSKVRTLYDFEDMAINIEDIENFGSVIEVEIITTKELAEEAKARIRSFLNSCHIEESQIVPKSVTNIIMKKLAHF